MISSCSRTEYADAVHTLKIVQDLKKELMKRETFQDKLSWIMSQSEVIKTFNAYPEIAALIKKQGDHSLFLAGLLILCEQFEGCVDSVEGDFEKRLTFTLTMLGETDRFYDSIGGVLGYIEKALQIFSGQEEVIQGNQIFPPPYYDMRTKKEDVWEAAYVGISRLSEMGELYAVGGAGDRLNLHEEHTGIPVPVAYLSFGGRPLMEHLFRDLEAREYVHFRVFGKQLFTPVLLMTSFEKGNARAIRAMVERFGFFGRMEASMQHVVQPLVPLIGSDGKLVFQRPGELAGKPGGHGVIWKLVRDCGAFTWLKKQNIQALLVRQINNPLSGLDHALSALVGLGIKEGKSFGFASCPRRHGFAEGLNVALVNKERYEATISNIEYTKFEHLTASETEALEKNEIPANANILFARMSSIEEALQKNPIPGLIVNAKNHVVFQEGAVRKARSMARLEATMQNIADTMVEKVSSFEPAKMRAELSTFLQLYDRSKLMSVTKKAYQPSQSPFETPESCFYDWYVACYRLLCETCGFSLPPVQSLESFLQEGPHLLFFFHPALGPFWEVVSQKLQGGTIAFGSELELEIAELFMKNLSLQGSLRVVSDSPTGQKDSHGVRWYANHVGRAFFENVTVENKGVKQSCLSDHVKRNVQRTESCMIRLEGASELIAKNISIKGDFHLVIPHGKRAILSQEPEGKLCVIMEEYTSPSWEFHWYWAKNTAPQLCLKVY